jgi:coenzyme F420-0:L-glutamate ligase/coenzyme F420-1:gamma-L-glutamate ligase
MNVDKMPGRLLSADSTTANFIALSGIPRVRPGDNLVKLIMSALATSREQLRDGDVLIIAQKIVSKAQGRLVRLASIDPSEHAKVLARKVGKDARLVELILRESSEVVAHRPNVLIVAHKLGFVMANAGIDRSNVDQAAGDTALLLPEGPDAACAQLRSELQRHTGADIGVIINDSHGRAFRKGTVGVAIGVSGIAGVLDRRGEQDLYGRVLESTEVGLADEIAAAASLIMGQANESRPVVIARGIPCGRREGNATELIRQKTMDLFRTPTAEAVLRGRRSIRCYEQRPIPEAVVADLLEAAICAPSAHNRQPWRFAVLATRKIRQRLAHAMAERLRADRTRDGDDAAVIEADVTRSIARVGEAPLAVLTCLTMAEMDFYPDGSRKGAEREMAVQSTAMAVQNLLLAAAAVGLGSSIMCAPLFCPDTVRTALDLPSDWEPQALITLGYPATKGKPLQRRDLAEVVRFLDGAP